MGGKLDALGELGKPKILGEAFVKAARFEDAAAGSHRHCQHSEVAIQGAKSYSVNLSVLIKRIFFIDCPFSVKPNSKLWLKQKIFC